MADTEDASEGGADASALTDKDRRRKQKTEASRRRRARERAARLGLPVPPLLKAPNAKSEEERLTRVRFLDRKRHEREREARNKSCREYQARNRERLNAARRAKRAENPEEARRKQRVYSAANKQAIRNLKAARYAATKDAKNARRREKYKANPTKNRVECRKWYESNQELAKAFAKKWRAENPGHEARRRKSDIQYRLACSLRSRVRCAVNRARSAKSDSTFDLVGCTISALMRHLESTMPVGATWDDLGFYGLHIDHIRPLCTFNLSDPSQQAEAFHYSNLRLLQATANMKRPRATWRP